MRAVGDDHEDSDEAVEFALQRRPAPVGGAQGAGDPAELAIGPSGDNDAFSLPENDAGARVRDRPPVGQRRLPEIGCGRRLLRQRFSGQDAAVDRQHVGANDPEVSRNDVAHTEEDDVAGNELSGRNLSRGAVAPDIGHRRGRRPELFEGPLGAKLRDDVGSHDRHQTDKDQEAVADLPQNHGEDAGECQQDDERLGRRVDDRRQN